MQLNSEAVSQRSAAQAEIEAEQALAQSCADTAFGLSRACSQNAQAAMVEVPDDVVLDLHCLQTSCIHEKQALRPSLTVSSSSHLGTLLSALLQPR